MSSRGLFVHVLLFNIIYYIPHLDKQGNLKLPRNKILENVCSSDHICRKLYASVYMFYNKYPKETKKKKIKGFIDSLVVEDVREISGLTLQINPIAMYAPYTIIKILYLFW